MYIFIYIYIYIYVCIHIYICIYICIYIYICVCVFTYAFTYSNIHKSIFSQTITRSHASKYTYTHTLYGVAMCFKPRQVYNELDTPDIANSSIASDFILSFYCLQAGRTALHWAKFYSHTEIVVKLILAGANLDLRDNRHGLHIVYDFAYTHLLHSHVFVLSLALSRSRMRVACAHTM